MRNMLCAVAEKEHETKPAIAKYRPGIGPMIQYRDGQSIEEPPHRQNEHMLEGMYQVWCPAVSSFLRRLNNQICI